MNLIVTIIGALCFFFGIWVMFFYKIYYQSLEKEKRFGFPFKLKAAGIGLIIMGLGLIFKSCS